MNIQELRQNIRYIIDIVKKLYGHDKQWDGVLEIDTTGEEEALIIKLAQLAGYDYDVKVIFIPLEVLCIGNNKNKIEGFIKTHARVL